MIRAVIDTNVLVSGLISPTGNEALLVLAVNQGLVVPVFSSEILEEYSAVLLRPKFGFSPTEIDSLLALLGQRGESFNPVPLVRISNDPGDDKFIACALASKSDFLVTGNKRHFPREHLHATRIVSATELLEIITLGM
jgi:putative PIN family toxin of toxin-antitoxin system